MSPQQGLSATYAPETPSATQSWAFPELSRRTQLCLLVLLGDLIALTAAYHLSLPLARYVTGSSQVLPPVYLFTYIGLSLAVLCFLSLRGHYSSRVSWWNQVRYTGLAVFLALLADGFISFSLGLDYPAILIEIKWATAFVMIALSRLGICFFRNRFKMWDVPTVIVADAGTATDILYALESDQNTGMSACALLLHSRERDCLDRDELPETCRNIKVLWGDESDETYLRNHPDLFYIVSLEGLDYIRRNRLIRSFQKNRISFTFIPASYGLGIYQAEPRYFFGTDIMLLNAKRPAASGMLLKKVLDVAGSAVGLVVFAIPMLIVVLMLKLEGQKGTPFYGGKRVGQGGRLFRCWKFETMGPDSPETDKILEDYLNANPQAKAHWDRYFKLPDDPRVKTRTARFIRKTSLDELPQLWNVLKGDMSLVGPRPILPSEIEAYGDRYAEYVSVKPGITGLWQVSGRNNTSFQRRVIWDSWYVRNWTLWGDIVILFKTVQAVFSRSGAS